MYVYSYVVSKFIMYVKCTMNEYIQSKLTCYVFENLSNVHIVLVKVLSLTILYYVLYTV